MMNVPALLCLLTPLASLIAGGHDDRSNNGHVHSSHAPKHQVLQERAQKRSLTADRIESATNKGKEAMNHRQTGNDNDETGSKKENIAALKDINMQLDGSDIMAETVTTGGAQSVSSEDSDLLGNLQSNIQALHNKESTRSKRAGEVTETNTTEEITIQSHLPPSQSADLMTVAMKTKGKAEAALVPILKLSKSLPEAKPYKSNPQKRDKMGAASAEHMHHKRHISDQEQATLIPGTSSIANYLDDSNDLMSAETPALIIASTKTTGDGFIPDLMNIFTRQKRQDEPKKSHQAKHHKEKIHHKKKHIKKEKIHIKEQKKAELPEAIHIEYNPPLADDHSSEISVKADEANYRTTKHKKSHTSSEKSTEKAAPETASKSSTVSKSKTPDTKQQLSSIFSTIQQSHHHKLTRSDIRQLAKKAVMLATLKHVQELNNKKSKVSAKKEEVSKKPASKATKKSKKVNSEKHDPVTSKATAKSDQTKPLAVKKETSVTATTEEKSSGTKKEELVIPASNNTERPIDEFSISSSKEQPAKQLDEPTKSESTTEASEFSEDVTKQNSKKENGLMVPDDAMISSTTNKVPDLNEKVKDQKTSSNAEDTTKSPPAEEATKTPATAPAAPTEESQKATTPQTSTPSPEKTTSSAAENLEKNSLTDVFDDTDTKKAPSTATSQAVQKEAPHTEVKETKQAEITKKSEVPTADNKDKIRNLKSVLSKANPSKVPTKFLPDLPAGLRMIAWKELLKKKTRQLTDLEVESQALGLEAVSNEKPVTINIDIDPETAKATAKATTDVNTPADTTPTEETADKKDNTGLDETSNIFGSASDHKKMSKHIKYLQKHISGARSLRKLVAKTLVGHCKSTGRRILEAFIAMDKALERAQAIAAVIGKKFHVNPDRIENLVGDKEDEVVETFLRDIFTKLDGV